MKHRRVGSVMTGDVVRAWRTTPRKDVESWLDTYDISGLPVVDTDDKVIGVVSTTDLRLTRQRTGSDEPPTAGELMSAPAVTVRADDSLVRAARFMAEHRIERLPVVDEEARLVGIVTRRDLLRIFLRTDGEIRDEVIDEVMVRALWLTPQTVEVAVHDGVVTLRGRLENSADVGIAVSMTRQIDGVVGVVNRLTNLRAGPPLRG
ncbi:CBS domain-containing protein [Streptomyces piniterrae]|uniref:CBS domain-containing protein n=1 Tax=Streptomyces piniterrae TaxID=2571125 RepID=A0A4V6WHT9_9ACTN|nr:CBS domain-containing protein [Streptomyces piniterrae]TJZ58968.1 CBS domain-containing protein [Streptomyces piniterrae]